MLPLENATYVLVSLAGITICVKFSLTVLLEGLILKLQLKREVERPMNSQHDPSASAGSAQPDATRYAQDSQDADEQAVQPFLHTPSTQSTGSSYTEVTETADDAAINHFAAVGADSPQAALAGTGFTYRHDWGRRRGDCKLNLNMSGVNARSRVMVSIGEGVAGGPDNGKFIGAAKYTVHNVAPHARGVTIWVNIEWSSDILLYVDYMVVTP